MAQPAPTVTAISPNGGSIANGGTTAGGTQVTITGTNFANVTSVTIGSAAAEFSTGGFQYDLDQGVDAGASPGCGGCRGDDAGRHRNGNKIVHVCLAPADGDGNFTGHRLYIAGGTAVTITGTNFTGATSITIGGIAPTAVTVVSATSITATTPAHAAGAVSVVVTTPAGTGTGTNLFTYSAPASLLPTVTAVSPATGLPGGGTTVTITGTNFTGVTAVMFGGANAAFFTIVSTTSISARSPAGSGTVHVTVITAAGTSAAGAGDQFNYARVATSLNLTSSPNPSIVGQAVTFTAKVTGSNPTGAVTFTENGQVIGTGSAGERRR